MSLDRYAVIQAIETILGSCQTPRFTVITGEPVALPPDQSPFACFWYESDPPPPEGRATLRNVMLLESFTVLLLWHRVIEREALRNLELEIWDANRTLKAAFRADSTLNGEAADLDITTTQVSYGHFPLQVGPNQPAPLYRTAEFTLQIKDLEGEAITA